MAQLSLVPPPEVGLLECAVGGRIARNAELRTSPDGSVHMSIELLQPKGRLPFVAMRHARADEADDLRYQASLLLAGQAVLIRCQGIELGRHEGHDVLRPAICVGIARTDLPLFDPEPTA